MELNKSWSMNRLLENLEKMPIYWYVPTTYLILIVLLLPIEQIANWLQIPNEIVRPQNMPTTIELKILLVILVGPLFETLINQYIPYHFLRLFGFFRRNVWIIILLSSLAFGLAHDFSVQYSIHSTIVGFVLISTFIIRAKKQDSFLCTYLVHAFFNFMAVILSYFI
jgi:uncharacterized protein